MIRAFLFSLLLLIAPLAFSAITINGVSGGSFVEQDGITLNYTLYGGIAGSCTGDGSTPCNSCTDIGAGTNIKACNLQNVYASLPISISFTVDSVTAPGSTVKVYTENQAGTGDAIEYGPATAVLPAAGTYSVSLNWGYLCQNDNSFNASCIPNVVAPETAFDYTSRKVYVWVDQNNNGTKEDSEKKTVDVRLHYVNAADATMNRQFFCTAPDSNASGQCGFTLAVGDSKLFLDEVFGGPATGGIPNQTGDAPAWHGVALIPAEVTIDNISNSSSTPQIIYYDANGGLGEGAITGLQNYAQYCVLMGNVNKAQNIYKFNNDGVIDPARVCASPSEVVGMLSDKSCFISTAAFGSDMHQHVQLLREFRNEFLLTNAVGIEFVKLYYKLSPPLASLIEKSEILKAITRVALYPVIGTTWLVMKLAGPESDKK